MINSDGSSEWQPVEPPEPDNGDERTFHSDRPLGRSPRSLDISNNPEDRKAFEQLIQLMTDFTTDLHSEVANNPNTYSRQGNPLYRDLILPNVQHAIITDIPDLIDIRAAVNEGINDTAVENGPINEITFSRMHGRFSVQVPYVVDYDLDKAIQEFKSSTGGAIMGVRTEYWLDAQRGITKQVFIPRAMSDSRATTRLNKEAVVKELPLIPTIDDIEYLGGTVLQLRGRLEESRR